LLGRCGGRDEEDDDEGCECDKEGTNARHEGWRLLKKTFSERSDSIGRRGQVVNRGAVRGGWGGGRVCNLLSRWRLGVDTGRKR
jgi:CTP-dependent riboflavin kinase